jgi:hypothetical protein
MPPERDILIVWQAHPNINQPTPFKVDIKGGQPIIRRTGLRFQIRVRRDIVPPFLIWDFTVFLKIRMNVHPLISHFTSKREGGL